MEQSRHSGSQQHSRSYSRNRTTTEEINTEDWKEYLSPTSSGCIPFVSMTSFEKIFVVVYITLQILSLAYKYNRLVYPSYAITTELITISAFLLTQPFRFYFADKGIQNQHPDLMLYYIIITGLSLLSYIFFLRLQLYVTFLEVILNSIGLGFTAIEMGLGVWVFVVFYQRKRLI